VVAKKPPTDREAKHHVSLASGLHKNRQLKDETLTSVIELASEVIGNRDEAMRWLGTPVRGLNYATPISLLGTKEGAMRVTTFSAKWNMAFGSE